jgi:C1A family cysteine protease
MNTKILLTIVSALALVGTAVYFFETDKQTTSTSFLKLNASQVPDHIKDTWTMWKKENNKAYGSDAEDKLRMEVFYGNYNKVQDTNSQNLSYRYKLNEFADLTSEEFKSQYLGLKNNANKAKNVRSLSTDNLPSSVNWVTKGAVTPVKNQGQCGSCWAFSTTGSSEGAYFLKNGELKSFSEQQLVDCAGGIYQNQGCNGGLMDNAFNYIQDKGIELESEYGYTARTDSCKYDASETVMKVASHNDVNQTDADLAAAVAQTPVSVAIDANPLQLYFGGIYSDWECGTQLDHGVLVVGYGSENGKDYYLVKNSWGASWGEQGYFRFARRSYGTGMCGITLSASYPTIA